MPTILVVDDSPTELRLVTGALQRQGYEILTATDGDQAVAKAAATHRVRIAVVDDSPTIRKLVQAKLAEFDFTVLPLADGDEAIARLPEFKPHLVLMDINMPGKDGYQMCRWVKAHKALRDTPVVMLSGDDGFFDKVRGRMAGASRHIGKPFNTDELLQVIDSLCAKARRAT